MNDEKVNQNNDGGNKVAKNLLVIMHPLTIKMRGRTKPQPPFKLRIIEPESLEERELKHTERLNRFRMRPKL